MRGPVATLLPAAALLPPLLLLLRAGGAGAALSCFKCSVLPPPAGSNETARLCAHFDGSARFRVRCPFSTFCVKRQVALALAGRRATAVERDCAPQRYSFQRYDEARGRWRSEDAVADGAYAPGCAPERGEAARALKSARATYCYCQSHLCNGAPPARAPRRPRAAAPAHADAMAVILVFNAVKYVRSLR